MTVGVEGSSFFGPRFGASIKVRGTSHDLETIAGSQWTVSEPESAAEQGAM